MDTGCRDLRILTDAPRRPWRLDGAFWLYGLTIVAGIAISTLGGRALSTVVEAGGLAELGLRLALLAALLAPFAPWVVAIGVERPLAWRPGPFLRRFGAWLPPLLLWGLVIIAPLAVLHGWTDAFLIAGAGQWFWPLALIDGPFSTLIAMLGFSLNAAAYRRLRGAEPLGYRG